MAITIVAILIAISVATGCYAISQLVLLHLSRDTRRLAARLEMADDGMVSDEVSLKLLNAEFSAGLPRWLVETRVVASLEKLIIQASPDLAVKQVLLQLAGFCTAGFVVGLILTQSTIVSLAIAAITSYVPILLLSRKAGKRQQLLAKQLPDALDFLSRVLRAGHSLSTAVQMLGQEMPDPIGQEFRKVYDQHSLGQSLDDAFRALAARVDSTDFAFFITAVLVQRRTGGDLSEVLNNIGGMIRQRMRLQQQVKAKTAEGRFTGYCLVAFPLVMFVLSYLLNPEYAGLLVNTTMGQVLLGIAISLQGVGLVAIQKITKVSV